MSGSLLGCVLNGNTGDGMCMSRRGMVDCSPDLPGEIA